MKEAGDTKRFRKKLKTRKHYWRISEHLNAKMCREEIELQKTYYQLMYNEVTR